MTTITTNTPVAAQSHGVFRKVLNALMRGFEAHSRKASRRDRIEALEAKSDAELARMGLTRDQIPFHVFRDLFYI